MTHYPIEPKAKTMLKDLDFCHPQEIYPAMQKTIIEYS